jgi:hypothetical protein
MYRVIYRNPFEPNSPSRIVLRTADAEEALRTRDNIWWSLLFAQLDGDEEPFVYCENLETGEHLK